jgi:outer membrane protein OmpA-like peptidoglycan-associated protein
MSTSHIVFDTPKSKSVPLRGLNHLRDAGSIIKTHRPWNAFWVVLSISAGSFLLFIASGCVATRGWVKDQLKPITGQLSTTDAKADQALAGLQNLHLERRLVLDDSGHGPTFAFGSTVLTDNAKHEIDGFIEDLEGSANSGSAPDRLIVVAGHTDSVGPADYNYELGQRRAQRVAGYLVNKDGLDPTQLRVVSYGASKPIADNNTLQGRRSNRRVEILVYQEKIATRS